MIKTKIAKQTIIAWLQKNTSGTADIISGRIAACSSENLQRTRQLLAQLKKAGIVEAFDAGERAMHWKLVEPVPCSSRKMILFPKPNPIRRNMAA